VSDLEISNPKEAASHVSKDIEYPVKRSVKHVTFYLMDANDREDAKIDSVKAQILRNKNKEHDNAGWFTLDAAKAFTLTFVGNKEAMRPSVFEVLRQFDLYLTDGTLPSAHHDHHAAKNAAHATPYPLVGYFAETASFLFHSLWFPLSRSSSSASLSSAAASTNSTSVPKATAPSAKPDPRYRNPFDILSEAEADDK